MSEVTRLAKEPPGVPGVCKCKREIDAYNVYLAADTLCYKVNNERSTLPC